MRSSFVFSTAALAIAALSASIAHPQGGPPQAASGEARVVELKTVEARTAGMKHMPGFLPLDWDAKAGKLYLEIPHLETDLLYTDSLPWGTGSNDLGLDRGQTSGGRIVRFERTGPKILLVQPNREFRSSATDPAEQLAVTQSFPQSVLWGFTVAAESPDGTVLVDASEFFLRDVHHVIEALAARNQGVFRVDLTRSTNMDLQPYQTSLPWHHRMPS